MPQVRAAYIEQIRTLHPDVNQDVDTTQAAAELNAAYELLQGGGWRVGRWGQADW